MKPNFPKLKLGYVDKITDPNKELDMVFEVSSINFDINQSTVSPDTPFTSELSFNLRLDKIGKPSPVGDLDKLDKFISELYPKSTKIDSVTSLIHSRVSSGINIKFDPQPEQVMGADVVVGSSVPATPYFVSVSLQSGDTIDLKSVFWLVQAKFLASMSKPNPETVKSVVLHPSLNFANHALNLTASTEEGEALNAELKLGFEALLQSAATATGTSSCDKIADSLGKASDEISDSFAQLGATLAGKLSNTITTSLKPVAGEITNDLALWVIIKKGTKDLSFDNYLAYMDEIFCGEDQSHLTGSKLHEKAIKLSKARSTPFMGIDAYQSIKVATEAFVMVNCMTEKVFDQPALDELNKKVPLVGGNVDANKLSEWWNAYRKEVNGAGDTIPYLTVIRRKMQDTGLKTISFENAFQGYIGSTDGFTEENAQCFGLIQEKLTHPCFLELIWSYWHEESMMVQGLNAVGRRFQNIKGPGAVDPLANLEIDPLRPLSNLMWGYIQDEQHRLTVRRRAYEYDHHYGITLQGTAVQNMRFADSRSKFIEAFHTLLHLTNKFYKQADDVTVRPDGFPIMNALKETHLILSEGAHNQYGDLPSVARAEMLMQQWLLARPEFREFLPTRIMVAYPERWMDRASALNNLMGWTKTSVQHFRDLGVFGEQLLLSIRFGNWASVFDQDAASNWAKFWRPQIQAYIHAYRAATGIDLTADVPGLRIDSMQPSVHLQRRLMEQRGKAA